MSKSIIKSNIELDVIVTSEWRHIQISVTDMLILD